MNRPAISLQSTETDLNRAAITSLSGYLENHAESQSLSRAIFRSATNEEKYSNEQLPYGGHADLYEVFDLMRSLNYKGITDATVGTGKGGQGLCLADALNETCDVIAEKFNGVSIDYVELGPEPVKTELLLSALRARGVHIDSYTSIDINPSSAKPMREVVSRVWSEIDIHHLAINFHDLTAEHLGKEHPVVFTSLGFQEGNHTPSQIYAMLQRIMRPGDIYLSEMQTYTPGDTTPIEHFYQLREMRLFSRNCLRRAYGDVDSTYVTSITDIDIDGITCKVAICHEDFQDDSGRKVYLVTNYCLKYTKQELRHLREAAGEFGVISEISTGDGSLLLQICERLPETEPA